MFNFWYAVNGRLTWYYPNSIFKICAFADKAKAGYSDGNVVPENQSVRPNKSETKTRQQTQKQKTVPETTEGWLKI